MNYVTCWLMIMCYLTVFYLDNNLALIFNARVIHHNLDITKLLNGNTN